MCRNGRSYYFPPSRSCGNIGEDVLTKFNIILQNDDEKYLEDVSIHVKIPREGGVIVMDHVRSVTVLKHCVHLSRM